TTTFLASGLDDDAKFEIAKLMEELCKEGMAILFVSSELEEVVRSSRRIVVLRDRRKVAELSGDRAARRSAGCCGRPLPVLMRQTIWPCLPCTVLPSAWRFRISRRRLVR